MRFWGALVFVEADQVLELARACEALGFHGVTVSDRIFSLREPRSRFPYSPDGRPVWGAETEWPDPWVLISAAAAVTSSLRLLTSAYIAPARDLFTVAKLVSTTAVLSAERVAFGCAPGWCREEFEQTGQEFGSRGRRLDEMITALRRLWTGEWVEFHGRHYDFEPLRILPVPRDPIPVYVGGDTEPAFRRAATMGDGWIGNPYPPAEAEEMLSSVRRVLRACGRKKDQRFEVIIGLQGPPDPDVFKRIEERGATGVICAPWMSPEIAAGHARTSLNQKVAAAERFAEEVIAKME